MGPKELSDQLNKPIETSREMRRKKPPTDPIYTKATHSIKKKRDENAKRKAYNERKLKRTRKDSQEDHSQGSEG